jgi:hypothetical protein
MHTHMLRPALLPPTHPQECQKAAWPQHKRACNSRSSSAATSPTSNGNSSTSPRQSNTNGSSSSKTPGSVLDALKQVLQQHSSVSADDPLQQQFEQAVLLFVSGEHRAAAAALQAVQAAAEAQGKKEVAGMRERAEPLETLHPMYMPPVACVTLL